MVIHHLNSTNNSSSRSIALEGRILFLGQVRARLLLSIRRSGMIESPPPGIHTVYPTSRISLAHFAEDVCVHCNLIPSLPVLHRAIFSSTRFHHPLSISEKEFPTSLNIRLERLKCFSIGYLCIVNMPLVPRRNVVGVRLLSIGAVFSVLTIASTRVWVGCRGFCALRSLWSCEWGWKITICFSRASGRTVDEQLRRTNSWGCGGREVGSQEVYVFSLARSIAAIGTLSRGDSTSISADMLPIYC